MEVSEKANMCYILTAELEVCTTRIYVVVVVLYGGCEGYAGTRLFAFLHRNTMAINSHKCKSKLGILTMPILKVLLTQTNWYNALLFFFSRIHWY